MGGNRITLLLLVMLLLPAVVSASSATRPNLQSLHPLINEQAVAQAGGEPVLLQFWASWCHSCSGIMFDMDELMEANPGFRYVAVSLDDASTDASEYIRKHALFEKYSDCYFYDESKALSGSMDVKTVPTIMLLDRSGDVLIKKSGHLNSKDKQELARKMKNAL